jgi:hypothetical protein
MFAVYTLAVRSAGPSRLGMRVRELPVSVNTVALRSAACFSGITLLHHWVNGKHSALEIRTAFRTEDDARAGPDIISFSSSSRP